MSYAKIASIFALVIIGALALLGGRAFAAVPLAVQPHHHHRRDTFGYHVRAGDTLSALSQRFGEPVAALAYTNHISDPNLIFVDQLLRIDRDAKVPAHGLTVEPFRTVSPTAVQDQTPAAHQQSPGDQPSPSGVWACIAAHESGSNPATNTGNGYYGMFQDLESTWLAYGGAQYAPYPYEATAAQQLVVNERVQAGSGWGAWPASSVACGV